MPAFPTTAEIDDYARRHGLTGASRAVIAQRILDDERRDAAARRGPRTILDAAALAAQLRTFQDAADAAGVRPDVLAAAAPVVARTLLQHLLMGKSPQ